MALPDPDLYRRLLDFPIDEGTPDLSFEARLARENGWDTAFARRVVFEYRRFVFLALTAGHTVTPSESVDQAWHLHLTYTRSYWERMCDGLLGRPLHHGPTRGGATESMKFRDLYTHTLAAYRAAFGEEPPADIWPPVEVRFGEDLHFVRVNTAQNWVVPKAPLRRGLRTVGFGFGVACAAGCGGVAVNPFDLVGTDFVRFLVPLLLAALAVGLVLRYTLRGPGARPDDDGSELDWADAAYLAGGRHRLTTAAVARLVAAGAARVSVDGKVLDAVGAAPTGLSEVERAVFDALPLKRDEREVMKGVARRVDRAFAARATELRAASYLLSVARMMASGFAAVLPLAIVAVAFGGPRLARGIETGKPVGILAVALFVAFATGVIVFFVSMKRLSRRGAFCLNRLRAAANPRPAVDATPDSVGQSVGLFGTSALAGCALIDLAAVAIWCPRPTPRAGDGGDGGGGCGTGCGASAGGDGGGGCGGGGCGGGCGGCGG